MADDPVFPFCRSYMQWESYQRPNHGRVFRLPPWLPDPCFIVGWCLLAEAPMGSLTDCKPIILNDPGGEYNEYAWGMGMIPGQTTELPPNAPMAHRQLQRITWLDMKGGWGDRFNQPSLGAAIRNSRSEGDLIQLDTAAAARDVWFCHSCVYWDAVSIGYPAPPEFSFGTGTWGYIGDESGRTLNNDSGKKVGGFLFQAPSAGEVYSVKFRVVQVRGKGSITARLYSDNNGIPGSPIGDASWPWAIRIAGDQEVHFPLGCHANTAADTNYWIILTRDDTELDIDIDVCPWLTAYPSGRADSIANISNNLPNHDTWRMLVCAIEVQD